MCQILRRYDKRLRKSSQKFRNILQDIIPKIQEYLRGGNSLGTPGRIYWRANALFLQQRRVFADS